MNLEKIKDWEDIEKFLEKKVGRHENKNCRGFIPGNNCNYCKEYLYLLNYQQEIAKKLISAEKSPLKIWDNSFSELIKYMKTRYVN